MSAISDEIAMQIMANHTGELRDYLEDWKQGNVTIDFIEASIGEWLEEAASLALREGIIRTAGNT
jgi:hypothetical protein